MIDFDRLNAEADRRLRLPCSHRRFATAAAAWSAAQSMQRRDGKHYQESRCPRCGGFMVIAGYQSRPPVQSKNHIHTVNNCHD